VHLPESKHSAETRLQKADYHPAVLQQQTTSFKKCATHLEMPVGALLSSYTPGLLRMWERTEPSDGQTTRNYLTPSSMD